MRVMRGGLFRLVLPCALAALASACTTRTTPSVGAVRFPPSAGKLGEVLLREDFDDPATGRLPRVSDVPGVEFGYLGGEYLINMSSSFRQDTRIVGPIEVYANARVAVDVRLGEGTEARWVGVVCRLNFDKGVVRGFYVLGVFPATARFVLARYEREQFVHLVPFQSSEVVHRGNTVNQLELTCAGSTLLARINGTEVASIEDRTFAEGRVAVIAGRDGPPVSVRAWFDNLVVTEIVGL